MGLENIGNILRGDNVKIAGLTPLDLPNIGDLTDQEIQNYIEETIKEDITLSETFEKLNKIYEKSLSYLEEELFYNGELTRFKKLKKPFQDISDLINFLRATTETKGRMNCVIAKVFLSFYDSDGEFNERVNKVKEKTQGVIDGKLIGPLRVLKSNEDEYFGEEFFELQSGKIRKIPYKLKKRIKSVHSTVSKEIRDPEYSTVERTCDMHGLTFEVDKKEDILPLMQMVAGYVFKKGDYEIKNDKGMFSIDEIEKSTDTNKDFKTRILAGTNERDKPESGNVVDIKLLTPKDKDEGSQNMNIEIKFVIRENRNEKGLNMHGVYNYAKKIKERIRLEGFITHDYIELIASKFVENLTDLLASNVGREEEEGDDISPYKKELFRDLRDKKFLRESLKLRNPHVKCRVDMYLREGLVSYFKSTLTPVNVNEGKKIYYTNKRAINVSEMKVGGDMLTSMLD